MVYGERKKCMERAFMGVIRTTFIIDEKGIIEKIIQKSIQADILNRFSICIINKTNNMSKERKEINKEKLKALEVTLGKIEKDFGKGTIMKLGDHAIDNIQVISTGSIGLDAALGIGGITTRKSN